MGMVQTTHLEVMEKEIEVVVAHSPYSSHHDKVKHARIPVEVPSVRGIVSGESGEIEVGIRRAGNGLIAQARRVERPHLVASQQELNHQSHSMAPNFDSRRNVRGENTYQDHLYPSCTSRLDCDTASLRLSPPIHCSTHPMGNPSTPHVPAVLLIPVDPYSMAQNDFALDVKTAGRLSILPYLP